MRIKRNNGNTFEEYFLNNMGVKSLSDVNAWFQKSNSHGYRIDNLKEAVDLALSFKNRPVRIIGDYDGDGVTSTSILYLALKRAGFSAVSYRIPKRFSEGFGINNTIIDEINDGLIITCDNGIAQIEAINKAKKKGLTVIIIDHHMPVVEDGVTVLPDADIIIDPNAIEGSADFNGYCGAGLCYKFACELLNFDPYCNRLLNFAAIGTITDVMDLHEENYVFVRNGLKTLVNSRLCTTGLYALLSAFDVNKVISAKNIGFKIGPAINAASRMFDNGAMSVVKLLTYNGPYENAVSMAEKLAEINKERKDLTKEYTKKAFDIIDDEILFCDNPIIMYIPNVKEGLIGILAGKICEKYSVPAFVFTDSEDPEIIKGSGRSCGNYNMKLKLDEVCDLLYKYGGHEGAAGVSLLKENLPAFRTRMIESAADFVNDENADDVYYDFIIEAKDVPAVVNDLERFAPYGQGNPEPMFLVNNFSVLPKYGQFVKPMGDGSIIKLFTKGCDAICFDADEHLKGINYPARLSIVGTAASNYFNGETSYNIEISDYSIIPEDKTIVKTDLSSKLELLAQKLSN